MSLAAGGEALMTAPMKGWSRLQEIQESKRFCPQGHEYTEANTLRYRGARKCRECKRARARARYARRVRNGDGA